MDAKDVILGGILLGSQKSGGGGSVVVPDISATAESLPAGSDATVTKSGTNTNVVFNFGIPRGADGAQGPAGTDGADGQAATITVGTVTTGAPGSNASVTNSGTAQAAVLDFVIPQGMKGDPGSGGGSDLTAGDGVSIADDTVSVRLSENGGNAASFDESGALFVEESTAPTYTAGDGISIAGDQISVRVSGQADNGIGVLNGALYAQFPTPTALYPLVTVSTVPATASVQVTATKGDTSLNANTNESGVAEINLTAFGVWTISATIGDEPAETQIVVDEVKAYTATLSDAYVFGVSWDTTNPSTQLTRLTPQNDPNGLVTVAITEEPQPAVGTGAGSSPFDQYMPWSGMYVCNLNTNGQETAKQGDGSFSYSTADVMIWIPEFYYYTTESENVRYFYISDKALTNFEKHPGSGRYVSRYTVGAGYQSVTGVAPLANITRAQARTGITEKGANWFQYDFATYCAIIWLYIVEFADWNSQAVIGQGVINASAAINNGGTDSMTYHTGRAAGTNGNTAVQYRNIENLWGNIYQWVDGFNADGLDTYICINPAQYKDDTGADYTNTEVTLPSTGWIKNIGMVGWGLIPNSDGGSSTSYIPDYVYTSESQWRVLGIGGYWRVAAGTGASGLLCFYAMETSSFSNINFSARTACSKPVS